MFATRRRIGLLTLLLASAMADAGAAPQQDPNTVTTAATEQEHVFPLMKSLVKNRPNLPPPYGIAVVTNWMDANWKFTSGSVGINDSNVPLEFAPKCNGDMRTATVGMKADVWVLPFLDLFISGGSVHSPNQLNMRDVPLKFIPPSLSNPAQVVRGDVLVDFTLDGSYYNFGTVLAGGYKNFFTSCDLSASQTNFGHKETVNGNQSWVYSASPRVGYTVGLSQIWVGARYMDFSTHYFGTIPISSGQNFTFDVHLKTASWNATAGMRTILQRHWEVLLETGFAQRYMMTGAVGYRW